MRNKITTEKDLLPLAIEQLKGTTGIRGTLKPGAGNEDARLILEIPDRKKFIELILEVKRTLVSATAAPMTAKKENHVLVTKYVNPVQAQQLKQMGVQFIDCAGNTYINKWPVFVLVKGNKLKEKLNIQPRRLFKPGGLRIIFTLLCNPDLTAAPYRDIAIKAGVALGTVAWAVKDLQQQGYILDLGNKNRRLVKRDALLRIWLVGYEQLLRPRLIVNRYRAEKPDWWQKTTIEHGLWGGEIAAQKMVGYLKPQGVTVYALRIPDRLMLENRLRLDPQGEIEIMTPFWNFEYPEKKDALVPPLLVYADLMILGDGRTTETARIIYERYLARYFKED